MTKLGIYNYYGVYNHNKIFDSSANLPIGEDVTYTYRYLAMEARRKGIHISTIDTEPLDSYDAIIFLDFPTYHNQYFNKLIEEKSENLFLFLHENELIRPDNWKISNFRHFQRVYTWHDELVDNKFFFKLYQPNKIPVSFSIDLNEKKKFCCLIAWNKSSNHKLELYSERVRAIRWFEKNAPSSFDLYGQGWNDPTFPGVLQPLNRIIALKKRFAYRFSPHYPSYKWGVISKNDVLKKYKFAICYENARDIPGYITEKIFDCFFAGCIPIYRGASNITDYIPETTFIDWRKFGSYGELFQYMKNMSETEYLDYIQSIEKFVNGPKIFPFSAENYVNTVFQVLVD